MNFEQVRTLTITALFSDDVLFEQLVLKGGNAISLIHRISQRVSLDLDFSLEEGFSDLEETRSRMERALAQRFSSEGFEVFDVKLSQKPSTERLDLPWWGGYLLEFKLIQSARHKALRSNPEQLRREAFVIGPKQQKVFTVDFSKAEYCIGKAEAMLDDYTVYVYTPAMIVLEKLRAICQQMDEYPYTGRTRRPRARDFYDIYTVLQHTGFRLDTLEAAELLQHIFAAKHVPLALLGKIHMQREYHRDDWPSVAVSVGAALESFDFYFDFVIEQIQPLQALGVE